MRAPNSTAAVLTAAAWDIADYNTINQQAVVFSQQLTNLLTTLNTGVLLHVPVRDLSVSMKDYLRHIFKKKRTAASHIMVIMAADEFRRSKPYCIPLQYIPYVSIRDQQIRDLTSVVKRRVLDAGVLVVGKIICFIAKIYFIIFICKIY